MIIYSGEPEEYYSFITPEAYYALEEYVIFRKSSGENITVESVLIRDVWATTDFEKNSRFSFYILFG
jgi:hypothetical protein